MPLSYEASGWLKRSGTVGRLKLRMMETVENDRDVQSVTESAAPLNGCNHNF